MQHPRPRNALPHGYFVKLAANRSDAPRARLSTFTHLARDDEGEESTDKDDAPITMKPPDEAATVDTLPPDSLSGVLSILPVTEAFAFSSVSKAACSAVLELQAAGELVNSKLAERLIAEEKVPPALANKFAYVTRGDRLTGRVVQKLYGEKHRFTDPPVRPPTYAPSITMSEYLFPNGAVDEGRSLELDRAAERYWQGTHTARNETTWLDEDGFQVVRGRRRGGSTATSSGHAPSTM